MTLLSSSKRTRSEPSGLACVLSGRSGGGSSLGDVGQGSLNAGSATARGLAILETVSRAQRAMSSVELSGRLGLPNPTVHRLMILLEEIGFLQREPGGKRFIPGRRQIAMSLDTLINSPPRLEWRAVLRRLADEVEETCNFTMLVGDEVVYIDRVERGWPSEKVLEPGSRIPINGASGKLFWSFMPAAKRKRLLEVMPLARFTERTVVDPQELEKDLKKTRSRKFGLDDGEIIENLIGLAVPVFDARARICATVSIHVPNSRETAKTVVRHVPALQRAAERYSSLLPQTASPRNPAWTVPRAGEDAHIIR